MKRRGFLGLLAALHGLTLLRKGEAALAPAVIQPLPYKQPDPSLLALTEQINRDTDAEYAGHLTAVTMDVGEPGGDETAIAVWQKNEGKFVCTHMWYAPPGPLPHWMRTTDGRFLPIEEVS